MKESVIDLKKIYQLKGKLEPEGVIMVRREPNPNDALMQLTEIFKIYVSVEGVYIFEESATLLEEVLPKVSNLEKLLKLEMETWVAPEKPPLEKLKDMGFCDSDDSSIKIAVI